MSEKKNFPNIASMQDPGSQRTGYATGGRVKKAGGGKARVKKFAGSGPGKVGPRNLKAPSRRGPSDSQSVSASRRNILEANRAMEAQMRRGQKDRPGGRTGGKVAKAKGGRVSKAKGGKAKK